MLRPGTRERGKPSLEMQMRPKRPPGLEVTGNVNEVRECNCRMKSDVGEGR